MKKTRSIKNTSFALYVLSIGLTITVNACNSSKSATGNNAAQTGTTSTIGQAPATRQTQNAQPSAKPVRMEAKEIKEVK